MKIFKASSGSGSSQSGITLTQEEYDKYPNLVESSALSIMGIEKISTIGLVDTYQITFLNGTTADFTVTNGLVGENGLNAYELSGFVGTVEDWILSLKGESGLTTSVNGVEQVNGEITLTSSDIGAEFYKEYIYGGEDGQEVELTGDSFDNPYIAGSNGENRLITRTNAHTVFIMLPNAGFTIDGRYEVDTSASDARIFADPVLGAWHDTNTSFLGTRSDGFECHGHKLDWRTHAMYEFYASGRWTVVGGDVLKFKAMGHPTRFDGYGNDCPKDEYGRLKQYRISKDEYAKISLLGTSEATGVKYYKEYLYGGTDGTGIELTGDSFDNPYIAGSNGETRFINKKLGNGESTFILLPATGFAIDEVYDIDTSFGECKIFVDPIAGSMNQASSSLLGYLADGVTECKGHYFNRRKHAQYEAYPDGNWVPVGGDGLFFRENTGGGYDGFGNDCPLNIDGTRLAQYRISESEYIRIAEVSKWWQWDAIVGPDNSSGTDNDYGLDSLGQVWKKLTGVWVDTGYNLNGSSYIHPTSDGYQHVNEEQIAAFHAQGSDLQTGAEVPLTPTDGTGNIPATVDDVQKFLEAVNILDLSTIGAIEIARGAEPVDPIDGQIWLDESEDDPTIPSAIAIASGVDWTSPFIVADTTSLIYGAHYIVAVTSSNKTLTLPEITINDYGKMIVVEIATSTDKLITLSGYSGQLIDGINTRVMWAKEVAQLVATMNGWTKIGGKSVPMICSLGQSANQVITPPARALLAYDTVTTNKCPIGMYDISPANYSIICQRAGTYNYSASVEYSANFTAAGYRYCYLYVNGSFSTNGQVAFIYIPATLYAFAISPPANIVLQAGDILQIYGYYTGATIATAAVIGNSAGAGERLNSFGLTEVPQW